MALVEQEIARTYWVSTDVATGVVRSVQAEVTEVVVDDATGAQWGDPKKRFADVSDITALQAILGASAAQALADIQRLSALVGERDVKIAALSKALADAAAAINAVGSADAAWDANVRAAVLAAGASIAAASA